jgi:hypothetical protein
MAEKELGISFYKSLFSTERRCLLSIHITTLLAIINFWQSRHRYAKFQILHDNHSEMQRQKSEFDRTWDGSLNANIIGYESNFAFPLTVVSSSFSEKSDEVVQIGLCDLLAGAAADFFNGKIELTTQNKEFRESLLDAGIADLTAGGVVPTGQSSLDEYLLRRTIRERASDLNSSQFSS